MYSVMPRSLLSIYSRFSIILLTSCFAPHSEAFPQVGSETPAEESARESNPKLILLNENFPGTDWIFFSGKKDAKFEETWRYLVEPESKIPYVACSGQPYGYLRTKKVYRNFDMNLEWRFPQDENGNSGILLFTSGDDRIWPTSLQVQLQQPLAGSTFPSGGAKTSNELRNVPMLSRPVNQWNRCVISSREGTVSIVVNDQKVGTIENCTPLEGAISLQSEGSEIHFRNLWIKEFPKQIHELSKADLRRQKRDLVKLIRQGHEPNSVRFFD